MKKRILSVLLCLVMVLGLLPTAAFAAESSVTTGSGTKDDPYCVSTYDELKRLLESGSSSEDVYIKAVGFESIEQYLRCGKDYDSYSQVAIIVSGKKHLEIPKNEGLYFIADLDVSYNVRLIDFINIPSNAELSITGEGYIRIEFNHPSSGHIIANYGKLTIDGNVLFDGRQSYHRTTNGQPIGVYKGQTIINGGRFYGYRNLGPVSSHGSSAAVWVQGGSLEINGGEFRQLGNIESTGTYRRKNWPFFVNGGKSENVTLKGGTFVEGMRVNDGIANVLEDGYQLVSWDENGENARLLSKDELTEITEFETEVMVIPKDGLSDLTLMPAGSDKLASGVKGTIEQGKDSLYVSFKASEWLGDFYSQAGSSVDLVPTFMVVKNGKTLSSDECKMDGGVSYYRSTTDGSYYCSFTLKLKNAANAGDTYGIVVNVQPVFKSGGSTLKIADNLFGTWTLTTEEKKTSINSVTLNMSGKLMEGATSGTAPQITATGDGFSSSTSWYITDPTEAGRIYRATVTLTAEEGYVFTSGTALMVNGAVYDYDSSISDDGKTMTVIVWASAKHDHTLSYVTDSDYHWQKCASCSYTTEKEAHKWDAGVPGENNTMKYTCTVCHKEITVDTVSKITNLRGYPEWPQVGDSVGDYGTGSVIIGESDYGKATVTAVEWYEGESATGTPLTASHTFKADTNYTAKVTFTAADGCAFEPSKNDTLLPTNSIYGVTPTAYYYKYNHDAVYSAKDGVDNKVVTGSVTVYAANIKTSLDVTITLPTLNDYIGQSAPAVQTSTLPDGVTLEGAWQYNLFSPIGTDNIKPNTDYLYTGVFTGDNAKKYAYNVTIVAGDSLNQYVDSGFVLATYKTADTSKITSVALTVTAPEYGKAPTDTATGADNTRYTVGAPIWSPEVTDNKFGAGVYTVSIPVTAQSGYSFDENCTYTVNGYSATYADGKVSYTFPELTAPHEHDFTGQPWIVLDDEIHYQVCKSNDGGVNPQKHSFDDWTPDTADTTKHYRVCSVCGHKVSAAHNESSRITDTPAGIGTTGTWHTVCNDCGKQMDSGTLEALTKIDVTNLTVAKPVKGAACAGATTADSTYDVAYTEWMDQNGDPLAAGESFKPGTVYTAKITLEGKDNNVFSANSSYNAIEGKTATVNPELTGSEYAYGVVLTYTFDATEGDYVPVAPAITTTTLPGGKVGETYNALLDATGDKPITWSVDSGNLPDGLTLVGDTIKGTPSKAGSFTFTVKASNTAGDATQAFTVTIADADAAKYHNVTLSGAGTDATGAGSHAANTPVKIYAGTKSGYTFAGWTSNDVTVLSASNKNASFVMPDNDVTVKANWIYNGGSGGGGYTYYTIKATAGVNGSISPSGNVSVREGRDQTFTITPDKGYAVAKVLVDSKNVGAVKSYTFENVKKAHTIEVVFMKSSGNPQTGVFVDVPEGSYYEEAVNWAVEQGITQGTDATHFSPDGICTRAQAVTFLWRAAGSPAPKSTAMPFTDVKSGVYYYDAVLWAVENGITKGTTDTTFSPNMNCSRAQIVTFLWRSEKSPAAGTVNPFTDVKANAYYADAVLWAVKEDVTKGTTATTFSPDANCTRAQIVTFIYRALAE